MPRRVPYKRIKSNRSYTFEEAADVLGVTIATVRRWARVEGMPYLSDRRPYLILGWALKSFLKGRDRPCELNLKPTEFNCLTCKSRREPLGMMVDYVAICEKRGLLKGLCPVCGGVCCRIVSARQKDQLAQIFDLQISSAEAG